MWECCAPILRISEDAAVEWNLLAERLPFHYHVAGFAPSRPPLFKAGISMDHSNSSLAKVRAGIAVVALFVLPVGVIANELTDQEQTRQDTTERSRPAINNRLDSSGQARAVECGATPASLAGQSPVSDVPPDVGDTPRNVTFYPTRKLTKKPLGASPTST